MVGTTDGRSKKVASTTMSFWSQLVECIDYNAKGIIAAVVLFVMYVTVSTMEYNDCLRGAMSC